MNILKKLENLENVTPNERILIETILNDPERFLAAKPKEIASLTYVSVPTLYRLINKLGLSGVNDLKLQLQDALHTETETAVESFDFPISPTDTVNEIQQHLKDVYAQTIDDTLKLSDQQVLVEVSQLMQKAAHIDVYASAGNLFFAQNFAFQMQEINVSVHVPEAEYMQKLSAGNADATHLSIVISFGGRGGSMNTVCQILSDNQSPIVLITSTQKNPLTRFAKYRIFMSSYENHYQKISSFSTRLTLLYILDTLYSIYFRLNYQTLLDRKLSPYEKIPRRLNPREPEI